ncbi:MAG: tRNA (N6-threonylcarbamoyladenosine(37)-N6)-methyltransferase TrmO [Ignisphaera sp.]
MALDVIVLKPIGVVKHNYSDEYVKNSVDGVDGVVEVFQEFRYGLEGLEGFSHIIILAYLHKVSEEQKKILVVSPRGLGRKLGLPSEVLPKIGVFATDSPHRPNPIALTIARLRHVDINRGLLYVENLDLFNETPVLDLKPYSPWRRIEYIEIPQWLQNLLSKTKTRTSEDR